jgi:hypothetical protein
MVGLWIFGYVAFLFLFFIFYFLFFLGGGMVFGDGFLLNRYMYNYVVSTYIEIFYYSIAAIVIDSYQYQTQQTISNLQ